MLAPPYLSSDIYRYIWDGRVIAAGINPYRYVPSDPHLAALRDPEIFPEINRGNYARTIYPPVAQAIFFLVTRFGESLTVMKLAMVGFEAVAVALMLRLLSGGGAAGVVDRGLCLESAAIVGIRRQRPHRRGDARLCHAGAVEPATVADRARAGRRHAGEIVPGGAAAGPVASLGLADAGGVLASRWSRRICRLPGPARTFSAFCRAMRPRRDLPGAPAFIGGTWPRSVLPLGGVSTLPYIAAAGCLLAALAVSVAFRQAGSGADIHGAALLAAAFTVLLTPHYPWYFSWLVVFACLVASPALVWLTATSFLLYLLPVWPQIVWDRHRLLIESALYVPFLILAAGELWRCRRREPAFDDPRAARRPR